MIRALPLLLVACGQATTPATFAWEVDEGRFEGDPDPEWVELFTVVAADLDGDRDQDALFNRHHLVRTEIFENVGGSFVQLNPAGADRSGVWDNPGIPELFASEADMATQIAAFGAPGLFVWHDLERGGSWHLRNVGDGQSLRIRGNTRLRAIGGVPEGELAWLDELSFDVALPEDGHLTVDADFVSTQLEVRQRVDAAGGCFVGPELAPVDCARFELWKPDPHGVAWVDAFGGPEPELVITRGGLTGLLAPPLDPKQDLLFTWSGGRELVYDDASHLLPRDYGRGRQLSWLDVDHDGDNELFVACTGTPDRLLDREGSGPFVEVGAAWGLDGVEPESFAWVDVDDDGALDLVQNQTHALEVLLHRGDRFEARVGDGFGLVSPVPPSQEVSAVFNPFTIQGLDHDRDGDLDVWISAFGERGRVAVFANQGGGAFEEVTAALGLDGADGFEVWVPVDVDRDGWLDVIAVSPSGIVAWWSDGGSGFARKPVPGGLLDAVAADVDGDGRDDLVGLGPTGARTVVFDRHEGGGRLVTVEVLAPLGTLVRGVYADGSEQLQVFGGWTSRYSQAAGPLGFGSGGRGDRLVSLSLQVPGGRRGPEVEVGDRNRLRLAPR